MRRYRLRAGLVIMLAILGAGATPRNLPAQRPARQWEPAGFDFKPEGVWRRRARGVAELRRAAMHRGDFFSLNSARETARAMSLLAGGGAAQPSAMAVTGDLNVPVFLVRFKNTDTTTLYPPSQYASVLLDPVAPAPRAYTVRSLYEEMSGGLLHVRGVVIGWITLDSSDSWYAGGGVCDG